MGGNCVCVTVEFPAHSQAQETRGLSTDVSVFAFATHFSLRRCDTSVRSRVPRLVPRLRGSGACFLTRLRGGDSPRRVPGAGKETRQPNVGWEVRTQATHPERRAV